MKKETEEQGVAVFGTKEVSVKEFMGGTDKSLMLLSNYDLAKENLVALKEKHEARVEELVLVEKLSPSELKELNTIRGELREPRYLVQNIEKNNTSVFEAYKKVDKANLKDLIDINKLLEDKADDKIKLEEERKKNEKAEAERLEREREANLRKSIDDYETESYKIIQSTTITDVDLNKSMLDALVNNDIDYEEFDILFEQARMRVQRVWDSKCNDIQEKEQQRLDNERLEEQAKESKRLSDLQASRLTEMLPYVAFGEGVDLTKLSELEEEDFDKVFASKKALFDADVKSKQDAIQAEEAKVEEEKEAIYEIRKNRLEEVGMKYSDEHDTLWLEENDDYILLKEDVSGYSALEFEQTFSEVKNIIQVAKDKVEKDKVFEIRRIRLAEIGLARTTHKFVHADECLEILVETIYNADVIDFETIITDAKLAIEKAKSDAEEAEKQKAIDEELAIADAEKLKKERKSIVKKYVSDKKALTDFVDSLEFGAPVPEMENADAELKLNSVIDALEDFKRVWIDYIKNL